MIEHSVVKWQSQPPKKLKHGIIKFEKQKDIKTKANQLNHSVIVENWVDKN